MPNLTSLAFYTRPPASSDYENLWACDRPEDGQMACQDGRGGGRSGWQLPASSTWRKG